MTMEPYLIMFRLIGFAGQHGEICNTDTTTVMNEIWITIWKQQKKIIEQGLQGCIDTQELHKNCRTGNTEKGVAGIKANLDKATEEMINQQKTWALVAGGWQKGL